MLLGNQNVLNRHPGRDIGGGATGLGYERKSRNKSSMSRGAFYNDSWSRREGIPGGYPGGYAWILPYVAGTMASRGLITGTGTASATIITTRSLSADLAGVGTVSDADLALLTSLSAALAGSGSVTTADLAASLALAADLAGTGSLTAGMALLVGLSAGLAGTGAVAANLKGSAGLEADISPFSELSPESLAAAVWNTIAASFNEVGTMGEKMNDAGSAANPWTEEIETGYTAEELLRLISAALLGKVSGAETTTITFRDVNDTTDRITGTTDADGNRDAVTLDPT